MLTTGKWGGMVSISPQRKGDIVKVIVKRQIFISGKPFGPGDETELPETTAKYLANIGKVELKAPAAAKKETAGSKGAKGREKR